MKDEKKRTLYLKVRVSPEEMTAIKKKFENSGMSSLAPIPDLIDKKECDKIERKRRVRNERTKT